MGCVISTAKRIGWLIAAVEHLRLQHQANGFHQDQQIQQYPCITQVIEVVAELDSAIGHAVAIGIVDLSPAAEARAINGELGSEESLAPARALVRGAQGGGQSN